MSVPGRRRIVHIALVLLTIWPLFHIYLVRLGDCDCNYYVHIVCA